MSNDNPTVEAVHSTRWPTLQFFVILVLVAGGLSTLLSSLGCGGITPIRYGTTTGSSSSQPATIQVAAVGEFLKVDASTRYRPGDRIDVTMQHSGRVEQFSWTPPNGATNVRFLDVQPATGGPPFNFNNIDAATAARGIHVAYDAPPQEASFEGVTFLESSQMNLPDGSRYVTTANHLYTDAPPDVQVEAGERPMVAPGAAPLMTPAWRVNRFIDPPNVAMSTAVCQQYVTVGQSANIFVAIRVPTPAPSDTDLWPILPLISGMVSTPTLSFIGAAGQFKTPLIVQPAAMQWAQAMLPTQTGQTWLALGIDPNAALDCPEDYDMPAGRWSFFLEMMLDLSEQPDACFGCELPTYLCYRGVGVGQAAQIGRPSARVDHHSRGVHLPWSQ
ncbi:MAG: hypothetical protein IPK16_17105 [Anaerolineales bacterium]|nr:hypothetical protein [Anaerolineales bacterium]